MNLKDSGEHLVAHEILERELVGLHRNFNKSMGTMITAVEEIRDNVRELREDSAVTREKLRHVATDNDVSQAVSLHNVEEHVRKPINWKGITALITGVIAAVGVTVTAIIKAL